MLSEEKVKVMAKAAVFEKSGQRELSIHGFYRKDYVSYHVLLIWLCVTLAFAIVLCGVAYVYLEEMPEVLQSMDWGLALFTVFMIYIIVLFVFVIMALIVYSLRYERSEREVKKYQSLLKQLDRIYWKETPAIEMLAKEFEEPQAPPTQKTIARRQTEEKKQTVRKKAQRKGKNK